MVNQKVAQLGGMLRQANPALTFTLLEIGALPLEGHIEPFHDLVEIFPGSNIISFEIEESLCSELNITAKPGHKYFPVALGLTEETRQFYETQHPMCSSLYMPNEKLISMYNNMEVAMLKSVGSVDTVSLDYFVKHNGIDTVDFIKIDIQGAELDVFKGGEGNASERRFHRE